MSHTFNEHGVCMESNIPVKYGKDHWYSFSIKTAQRADGRWVCGRDYNVGTGGGGHAPWVDSKDNFPTEKEAILFALDVVERDVRSAIEWRSQIDDKTTAERGEPNFNKINSECKKMLAEIDKQRKALTQPQVIQQSLFDNF